MCIRDRITAKQQYCPFFTVYLTIKTLSQNISITLLQISLKLHKHRGPYWRKKLPWTILEEQFPVSRYTAASKIGNSVISLLWQLRCHCNPDHNKFSSYLIQLWWQFFEMFVYGVVVYAQKKLHRYWPWKTVSSHFHMLVRPMSVSYTHLTLPTNREV